MTSSTRSIHKQIFQGDWVRGKYAQRLRESSNIVVIKPEVAEAFPNEEAVNNALLALMKVAQKTTHLNKRGKKRKRHTVEMADIYNIMQYRCSQCSS